MKAKWQLYDLSEIKTNATNPALPQASYLLNPHRTFTVQRVRYYPTPLPLINKGHYWCEI